MEEQNSEPNDTIKKGQSATMSLLTYELCLTIEPNCMVIIDVKAKSDHYTSKKKQDTIILQIIS